MLFGRCPCPDELLSRYVQTFVRPRHELTTSYSLQGCSIIAVALLLTNLSRLLFQGSINWLRRSTSFWIIIERFSGLYTLVPWTATMHEIVPFGHHQGGLIFYSTLLYVRRTCTTSVRLNGEIHGVNPIELAIVAEVTDGGWPMTQSYAVRTRRSDVQHFRVFYSLQTAFRWWADTSSKPYIF